MKKEKKKDKKAEKNQEEKEKESKKKKVNENKKHLKNSKIQKVKIAPKNYLLLKIFQNSLFIIAMLLSNFRFIFFFI